MINKRIDRLVKAVGGREALATRLGVSYLTVMRWHLGRHRPTPLAERALAAFEKELDKDSKKG